MNCWLCGKVSYFAWTTPADKDGKAVTRIQHDDGTMCMSLEKPKLVPELPAKKRLNQLEMFPT